MRGGEKQYCLSQRGRNLLNKLDKIIPSTIEQWLDERDEWRRMLPDPIEDWRRPALIRLLEPLRYHRKGHPGKKKPKIKTKREVKICQRCGTALIYCTYGGRPAEYCPRCEHVNIL
jgi:formamidopyrimidine-DNA glycosylase